MNSHRFSSGRKLYKVIKITFLSVLIAGAAYSLVSLTTAVTRASFEQGDSNNVLALATSTPAAADANASSTPANYSGLAAAAANVVASATPITTQAPVKALVFQATVAVSSASPLQSDAGAEKTEAPRISMAVVKKTVAAPAAPVKKAVAIVKPVAKPAAKPTAVKSKSSSSKIVWAASAMKMMSNMASFDYSYSIRRSTMNKIENYARSHNVTVITANFINNIQD